jgi:hypothetical protein
VGSTRSWRAALVGAGGGLVWWLFPAAAIGSTAVSLLRATMKPPGAA